MNICNNNLFSPYSIDASFDDGSLGRLVNDSQKPNGKIKKIELDGKPHHCLFAIKDINKDDEITYDYGGQDLPWRFHCGQELCKVEYFQMIFKYLY